MRHDEILLTGNNVLICRVPLSSAISTTDAWVAGAYSLNEHWNGPKWQGGDNLANTYGMSSSSSNDVWAVGDAATYHFDGTRWTEQDPTISNLSSVRTTSPSSALAVGASHAVRWNGQRWKVVAGPNIGILKGVSLDSATDGWAAGGYGRHTFIEHWDGTSLTRVR